jgi:hypothetical protein
MATTPAQLVQDLVDLVVAEGSRLDDVGRTILARRIFEALAAWLPSVGPLAEAQPAPMSEAEARMFAATTLGFGSHADTPIGELPLMYLEWLADRSRQTWRDLDRYLNSPAVKRERQDETDPRPLSPDS